MLEVKRVTVEGHDDAAREEMPVEFPKPMELLDLGAEPDVASRREWLVTNGIGGFAAGTVSGELTRRYHGLLVAALRPPVARTLLVTKLEETVQVGGQTCELGCNRWVGGAVNPLGYHQIERFWLEGTTPVWRFACGRAPRPSPQRPERLEKRIWMEQLENTTYVQYLHAAGSEPITLRLKALVNYRDFHSLTTAGDWQMQVQPLANGVRVLAFEGAVPILLRSDRATAIPAHDWYRNYELTCERERGLSDHEDHLHVADFSVTLQAGDSVTFAASTEESAAKLPSPVEGIAALQRQPARQRSLLAQWEAAQTTNPAHPAQTTNSTLAAAAPGWIQRLVLAADQFVVSRPLPDDPDALSVIAGYHWFGDWGRDTMIALPGLALSTGRPKVAAKILRTFARLVSQGMLPNYFPDAGTAPEYNTVDANLWYFEAIRQYYAQTQDRVLLAELFPVLAEMIDWHVRGTRFSIHVDAADGLLYAGEPGVQLTWMDAKVGDWVVTPRIGKPVEINALWFNALSTMAGFAHELGSDAARQTAHYAAMAEQVRTSFSRFWNPQTQYCFDVIDGPAGREQVSKNDPTIRPNALFAVCLPQSPLTAEQQRAVVARAQRDLLTPCGLRSLAPDDPQYCGTYGGDPGQRDGAYHQGTVWGWLLGPFVLAHFRVHRDREAALRLLAPMEAQLASLCMGTLAEIFDGDAPHAPRGAVAQAWTVAEVLRAYTELSQQ